jgi:putative zinc finger protein
MEGTPLRPLPARPPGSIEPEDAFAHVAQRLPQLDATAAEALSLVTLAGRTRAEAAARLGIEQPALTDALTRARKALRRTLEPLPAGGWCERAERLVSDRLDGELTPRGEARLDAHLRSCERCVTHERRLIQAHDELVHSLAGLPAPGGPPPELRVLEPELPDSGRALAWYVLVALLVLLLVAAAVVGALVITGG